MADRSVELDGYRGMAAQKATELRRLRSAVEKNRAALKLRQDELETQLASGPAASWREAVEKTRYLLGLLAETSAGQDRRRQRIIHGLLADFDRLLALTPMPSGTRQSDDSGRPGRKRP